MSEREPIPRALLLAVAPTIASELGQGREAIRVRRERETLCAHGRPGGRLCATCSEARDV